MKTVTELDSIKLRHFSFFLEADVDCEFSALLSGADEEIDSFVPSMSKSPDPVCSMVNGLAVLS